MNDDIELSKELNNKFKKHKAYKMLKGFNMTVIILQSGMWPDLTKDSNIQVPAQLETYSQAFKLFYDARF